MEAEIPMLVGWGFLLATGLRGTSALLRLGQNTVYCKIHYSEPILVHHTHQAQQTFRPSYSC